MLSAYGALPYVQFFAYFISDVVLKGNARTSTQTAYLMFRSQSSELPVIKMRKPLSDCFQVQIHEFFLTTQDQDF